MLPIMPRMTRTPAVRYPEEDGIQLHRAMGALQEYGSLTDCLNCWALRLCGVCLASVVGEAGMSADSKKDRCEINRTQLHHTLGSFCAILERNADAFHDDVDSGVDLGQERLRKLLACVRAQKGYLPWDTPTCSSLE